MRIKRRLKNDKFAVSVVIGVILMVALTTSIALSVFVYTNNSSWVKLQMIEPVKASFSASSDKIAVVVADSIDWSDIEIQINGTGVDHGMIGLMEVGDEVDLLNQSFSESTMGTNSKVPVIVINRKTNRVIAKYSIRISVDNPPNTPSSSNPANHTTDVDINVGLGWTGGDPDSRDTVTYDVYFGTANPPTNKIVSNQTETTYDPGALSYETTYYWKIVAWDNHGASTSGPIWDFTTETEIEPSFPPNIPSNPDPEDDADSVNITADLNWIGGAPNPGDTVTYDVYFGDTSPPPQIVWNQSETTYDPGTLDYETAYYWKIIAWDNHSASAESPIWNFTTEDQPNQPPYIPNNPSPGNQTTGRGINADLSWTGGDPDSGDTVTYDVYLGTANPPPMVASNQTGTSYDPGTMENKETYYWKVVSWDNNGASTPGSTWHFTTKSNRQKEVL